MLIIHRGNAFARRDYLIAIPVSLCWLLMVYKCVVGNEGITDWIGGAVALIFFSAILALPLVYSRLALWILPTFLFTGLAASFLEIYVGGETWYRFLPGVAAWSIVTAAVWIRYVAQRRLSHWESDKRKSPSNL